MKNVHTTYIHPAKNVRALCEKRPRKLHTQYVRTHCEKRPRTLRKTFVHSTKNVRTLCEKHPHTPRKTSAQSATNVNTQRTVLYVTSVLPTSVTEKFDFYIFILSNMLLI